MYIDIDKHWETEKQKLNGTDICLRIRYWIWICRNSPTIQILYYVGFIWRKANIHKLLIILPDQYWFLLSGKTKVPNQPLSHFSNSCLRLQCSTPSALPWQILEGSLVVTEMLLYLAACHSKRAIHLSLGVILSGIYNHSKRQLVSHDHDLGLLR